MSGPCMCGDTHCPSCGPAQGNYKCQFCDAWADDLCIHTQANELLGELNKIPNIQEPERKLAEQITEYFQFKAGEQYDGPDPEDFEIPDPDDYIDRELLPDEVEPSEEQEQEQYEREHPELREDDEPRAS